MKQIYKIGLTVVTSALIFSACGGGGGSSTSTGTNENSSNNTPASTSTDVTVERGAVYNSVVTDANGQIAIQKDGQNVYTFVTNPVYPITATGGIIDVDGNGIDEGDIELSTPLTSYSNVISPITDYVGDTNSDSGKSKLAKLKEISGASDDELLKKAPSVVGKSELLALTNAIFSIKNDDDSTNDDFVSSYETSSFKTKFENLKVLASGYADKKEMAKALEEKVVDDLQISKLSLDEAEKNKAESGKAVDKLKFSDIGRIVNLDDNDYYSDGTINDSKSYQFKYNQEKYEWTLYEDDNSSWEIKKDETNPYRIYVTNLKTNEQYSETIVATKKVESLNGATYTDLYKTTVQYELIKEGTQLDWERDSFIPYYKDETTNEDIYVTDIDSLIKYYTTGTFNILYTNGKPSYLNSDGSIVNYKINNNTGGMERGNEIVGTWKKDGDYIITTSGKRVNYYRVVLDKRYYIEQAYTYKLGHRDSSDFYTGNDLDLLVSNIKTALIFNGDVRTYAYKEKKDINYTPNIVQGSATTYSLSGKDANKFNIDISKGTLSLKDFPTKTEYSIIVIAKNDKNQTATQNVGIRVVTEPKFKYSQYSTFIDEGSTGFINDASVINSTGVVYSLGGADANYFDINSTTAEVTFKVAPDYESGKILYSFDIIATNSSNELSKQSIKIEIRDILESFQSGETFKGLVYNIVTSPITGKKWLDRNLGATKVCESSTDEGCFGDYYQWGRLADGHEKATSTTTNTKATDILNAGDKFISGDTIFEDWLNADIDDSGALRVAQWNKADGTGVCPAGFRVPSYEELKAETLNYTGVNNVSTGAIKVINSATAYQNFLKLPLAGQHFFDETGSFSYKKEWGFVWTTSVSVPSAWFINFNLNDAFMKNDYTRAIAFSVRCIQN